MSDFKIDAYDLAWIDGVEDDPKDLCLHGRAVAIIGDKKLEYDATVSATGLCLLKTITEDHIINKDIQMFPCCGHTLIPGEDLSEVYIMGCSNGIDWTVLHEDGYIKIILEDGETTLVEFEQYKQEVFALADKIESFYNACSPKRLPKDAFEKNGYLAFWNEWHRRRNKQ